MLYEKMGNDAVPALGFGTYHLRGEAGIQAINYALDVGYRHLDTATRYENESEVGTALSNSGLDRSEIFLTTKLRHGDLSADSIPRCTQESLDRLQTDYVDLLLVHWPNSEIPLEDTMSALTEMKHQGKARHIGVSNYTVEWMRKAVEELGAPIVCNQIEYHPFLAQNAVLGYCREHKIAVTAAVPLARGEVEKEPVISAIAERHGKTVSQVTLRWLVQQDGVVAIPKSGTQNRIRENFEIFDFELTEEEMSEIGALGRGLRLIDPDWAPRWDPN